MKKSLVLSVLLFTLFFSYSVVAQKLGLLKKGYETSFPEKIQKLVLDPLPEGTYTIGTGGYFPTIDSAFNKLSIDGVSGTVTLELIDNQYTAPTGQYGYFLNGPIPGAGPNSRVTIKPAANKNVTVEGNGEGVMYFLNTSYVTIDGVGLTGATTLTIHALYNPQYQWNDCTDFIYNSDHNVVQYLTFISEDYIFGGGPSFYNPQTGSNASPDSNLIQNNFIKRAIAPILIHANQPNVRAMGNIIRGNIVGSETDSLFAYGIQVAYAQNTIVEKNIIQNIKLTLNAEPGEHWGINSYFGLGDIIRNNVVHNIKSSQGYLTMGIMLSGWTNGDIGSNNQVYNNMVYDIQSTSTVSDSRVTGIHIWYQNNPKIYYNSVYLSGTGTNKYGSAAFYITAGCTNVDLKNNILVNTRNESPYCASAIYDYSASNLFTTDYNDLYSSPNQYNCLVKIGSTKYNTLADWQVTGKDLHSITEMPNFIAPYLHINNSIPTNIESHGVALSGITTDFDGDLRNTTTPDIGADEFNGAEGIVWTMQQLPESDLIIQVKAIDLLVAWALGWHGSVFRTTDGGTSWTSVGTALQIAGRTTASIDAISANTAFVVGANYDVISVPPPLNDTTFIWRTTDGGITWQTVFSQPHGFIDAVKMISSTDGIAVGDPVGGKFTIVRSTDSGTTWSRIPTEPTQIGEEIGWFRCLSTFGQNYIWFGTSAGNNNSAAVYHSTDAGLTWDRASTPFSYGVFTVWFNDSLHGVCSDSSFARSTDGGITWVPIISLPGGNWYNDLTSVSVTGAKDLWAVVDSKVYQSTDLGVSWNESYTATNDKFTFASLATVGDVTAGWFTSLGSNIYSCRFLNAPTYVHETVNGEIPSECKLSQNYPNPFNPSTTFMYSIPNESKVIIKVYDILGNEIETLVSEEKPAGAYELTWNAANLPSGVYFYQLKAGEYTAVKKMILLK